MGLKETVGRERQGRGVVASNVGSEVCCHSREI